ncbi:hypothetical protein [Vibrio renipiscarius]|uniref:DNA mismatch repair protein n=1 Tax=Vibrio renipiscarius TaxID=1461322 RepID=A0A0C2N9I9_9VIBR|nr:hypothetical protein [Vibrio renipiscarius]KII76316.1 DNA mismatch repair protein [Vibrio renipiscarius]KII78161.1 DNA mismatch repair protein [Vibrio renipiscarius]
MRLRWPPAWFLVLLGLVLNILAIMMSSIVLEKRGQEVAGLSERKQDNLYSIQLAWNRVETLERKRESLLLYLAQPQPVAEVSHAMKSQLYTWLGEPLPTLEPHNVMQFMERIDETQRDYRDQIDEFYLGNVALTEKMQRLEARIAWYRNISLFLQVFGLALILSRDLARSKA